jgi:hypothetical protein
VSVLLGTVFGNGRQQAVPCGTSLRGIYHRNSLLEALKELEELNKNIQQVAANNDAKALHNVA